MALYNKYRPKSLSEIAGQDHIKKILSSQVSKNQLVHAYLFSGPAGTGKTTVARILAAMVNCKSGQTVDIDPLDEFVDAIFKGHTMDVVEIDAATNRKIDDIRSLRDKLNYAPAMMRKKVIIMDECHQLTEESWEALLKILEEPPPYALFILCTTEPQHVTETVKTRCMTLDFRPIALQELKVQLSKIAKSEKIALDEESLSMLANSARGSLRDGISKLEKIRNIDGPLDVQTVAGIVGVSDSGSAKRFVRAIVEKDFVSALKASSGVLATGVPVKQFLSSLADLCHDILMCTSKAYVLEENGYTKQEADEVRALRKAIIESLLKKDLFMTLIGDWIKILDVAHGLTVYNVQPQFHADFVFVDMWDRMKKYR